MATAPDSLSIVKQQADIVRVIGEYVKLKKDGAQNFAGLCPFHQEKSPSFKVHATKQFFHCFGCGASGDVIKFVQRIENISFPEALRLIAEKMEIKLPRTQFSSEQEGRDARLRAQLIEMHERAVKFFEDQLRRPEAAHARQYLGERGLNEPTIRTFRIGYAPDSGFALKDLLKRDYDEELLRASGLFSWKEGAEAQIYSRFRNRIMFPIARDNGKTVAFTGRTLATDDKAGPKYLNSPETAIYAKSQLLYNLEKAKDPIRTYSHTILVEGQMDCISVYAAGFHNVVASSGTAFTEAQVRLLGRFSKNIVVNFDPDTAGANAAEKSIAMLVGEEFRVKVLRLDEGYDPDLFIRKKGAKAYEDALRRAPNYFDYLVDRALKTFPVRTPEGKKNAVNYLLPHVQRVPSRIEREGLAHDLAQKLGIDSTVLRQEFRAAATQRGKREVKAEAETQLIPAEKVVIRALCSTAGEDAGLRRHALESLLDHRLRSGLATEALMDVLIENANGSDGKDVKDAMDLPFDDATRTLLARILLREDEPLSEELLAGALEALRHRGQVGQREREIKLAIVEAERQGDVKELLRLKQEKLKLDRKLAGQGLNQNKLTTETRRHPDTEKN